MPKQLSKILFSGKLLNIGTFDCPIDSPTFTNTGPVTGYLVAFPRTAVKIRHAGMNRAFVADPSIVTIYNKHQEYERFPLSEYGDRCDWMAVCPQLVAETLGRLVNPRIVDRSQLFQLSHIPSTAGCYIRFRQLVNYLQFSDTSDDLLIEEYALSLFVDLIEFSYRNRLNIKEKGRRSTNSRHLKLVDAVHEFLAAHFAENFSLGQLAETCHTSEYHLCRVFRQITKRTIYQTVTQLRLRYSLQELAHSENKLTEMGIKLGFSDHSHFTKVFRNSFKTTPSNYRKFSRLELAYHR